ncbi:MAG: phosphatidate cytidylyltransferase [Gammaproteobacteria bacterium]|nr:phosphatidate cytidylyltransferase [Gammaproteobacteria bacterium]
MLRSRVITALGLALAALALIYLLPPPGFALAIGLVALLAAWEWARFADLESAWQRGLYVTAIAVLGVAAWAWPSLRVVALWLGVAAWAVAIGGILSHRQGRQFKRWRWIAALLGFAVIWAAWVAAAVVHSAPNGDHWLVWLFILVSAVDIGAYFAGTAWGRRKLAPSLSPAKTWEGVAGGAACSILICGGALAALGRLDAASGAIIALLIAVSVFGDLLESLLKRQSGVKDSGTLLPGHGGLLDRVDSELAALPVFALLLPFV